MRWFASPRAAWSTLFAGLALISMSAGCQKEETTPEPQDPIPTTPTPASVIIDVEADGSGTTSIEACIEQPNGLLCGRKKGATDAFTAASGGESAPLEFQMGGAGSDDFEAGAFVGELTGDDAEKAIVVSWDGEAAFEATLPAPLEVTTPAAMFSLATDTVTVQWSPSGENDIIEWSYSAKCSNGNWSAPGSAKEDDDGELTIPAEGFSKLPADGCTVTVELGRRRKGAAIPEAKREGFISAAQVRTATFMVTP